MLKPEEMKEQVKSQLQTICDKEAEVIVTMYTYVYEATEGMTDTQREFVLHKSMEMLFNTMEKGVNILQDSLKKTATPDSIAELIKEAQGVVNDE